MFLCFQVLVNDLIFRGEYMKNNARNISLLGILCVASSFSCNAGKKPLGMVHATPTKSELLDAVIKNSLDDVRNLINFSPSDWPTSDVAGEAFELAAEQGHIEIMEILLTKLPPNQRPRTERISTVISQAIMASRLPVIKLLVKKMNKAAVEGALFTTACFRHLRIMNFLLELPGDKRPSIKARMDAFETLSREIPELQVFFKGLSAQDRLSEESFNKALNIAIEHDPSFREARENLQSEYLGMDLDGSSSRLYVMEDHFTVEDDPSFERGIGGSKIIEDYFS